MRSTMAALFTACALGAAACTVSPAGPEGTGTSSAADVNLPPGIIPVPLVRQSTDYTCGDVSTLAVLRYWKHDAWANVTEMSLYMPLMTRSGYGTDPQPIADFLNAQPGIYAQYRTQADGVDLSSLERAIDAGEPPIVDFEAWQSPGSVNDPKPWATDYDDGHYSVLVGYDADNLYFMDPSTIGHYAYVPRAEFLDRWHDTVGSSSLQHMVIFVHATTAPTPATGIPGTASRLH